MSYLGFITKFGRCNERQSTILYTTSLLNGPLFTSFTSPPPVSCKSTSCSVFTLHETETLVKLSLRYLRYNRLVHNRSGSSRVKGVVPFIHLLTWRIVRLRDDDNEVSTARKGTTRRLRPKSDYIEDIKAASRRITRLHSRWRTPTTRRTQGRTFVL